MMNDDSWMMDDDDDYDDDETGMQLSTNLYDLFVSALRPWAPGCPD